MNLIFALLLTIPVVIISPHGDDEAGFVPLMQAADHVTVVVMTDGAASRHCGSDCETARRASTEGFLEAVAPHAELIWLGHPDGRLVRGQVEAAIRRYCDGCLLVAAGHDRGHPDHDVTHQAVRAAGGWVHPQTTYYDPAVLQAVGRHYGWLRYSTFYEDIGLARTPKPATTILGGVLP